MAGIDEGWEGCDLGVKGTQHYLNGTPAVNPRSFPDMKGLVDYGHSKGVEMCLYYNGCGCIEKREPASGWDVDYAGDIRSLAAFGFDAVKFDGCGRLCNLTMYADLMHQTGRAFAIENCHWGFCTDDDASSCPTQEWCPFNWFRTSGDSDNGLGTWYRNLQTTRRFQDWDAPVSQPSCWAYPDLLQVGRVGCGSSHTSGCAPPSEQLRNWTRAHFAAFAIVSSPLVLSIHPSDANLEPLLDIIGNKGALAVNHAWHGHPGLLVKELPPTRPPAPPIKPGDTAVTNATDATQLGWSHDEARGALTHAGLCLSTAGMDLPLTLAPCAPPPPPFADAAAGTNDAAAGSVSSADVDAAAAAPPPPPQPALFQNFTFDKATGSYRIVAPAGRTLAPCCLQDAGSGHFPVSKVDVYRCTGAAVEKWTLDPSAGGTLCAASGRCVAGRDAYTPPSPPVAGVQWWAKPLGAGRVAALCINGGALPIRANITMAELNVTTAAAASAGGDAVSVAASDVWTGADAGPVAGGVFHTGDVAAMDSRFLIFAPSKAPTLHPPLVEAAAA